MAVYKYNEERLLEEVYEYINSTYDQHYSQNKYQATEFILDSGHGAGFCIGNIMKYAQRYGHKGDVNEWRKDLMKVIHYAIIALHNHDNKYSQTETTETLLLNEVNNEGDANGTQNIS